MITIPTTTQTYKGPVSMSERVQVQVPALWVGLEELPVLMSNAFKFQVTGPDEVSVGFGNLTPPSFSGTPEEQEAQTLAVRYVEVRGLARFAMTAHRARELYEALGVALAQVDQLP